MLKHERRDLMDNSNITGGSPTEEQLEKINKLARRPLTADETYVFSVVLCDNEVDRDNERFTVDALHGLSELFVGKTGIFDHSMQGRDQCARIFACSVVSEPMHKTSTGEAYHCLKAEAYMPRTESNRDLLLEIDAGIKKEVSVGCATAARTCSVCGADLRRFPCGHIKGKTYKRGGVESRCHTVLSDPTDAYEWSFVAVPAQPRAGVTKAFCFGSIFDIDSLIKSAECDAEGSAAAAMLRELKMRAEEGALYRDELCNRAKRFALLSQPALDESALEIALEFMNIEQLKSFADSCEKAVGAVLPLKPQLSPDSSKQNVNDQSYII